MFVIFRWNLGSGRVCNGLEMAVGFKWTDSQPISTHLRPFSTIFMISVILVSIPMVGRCFRKVPGPSETALKVPGPCETVLCWSDAASGRSHDPLAVSWGVPGPSQGVLPNWSELLWTSRNLLELVGTCRNLSSLVGTCRNSCGLKGPTLGPYIHLNPSIYI